MIPLGELTAAQVNLTATDTQGAGYLTAYSCLTQPWPGTSNANFEVAETTASAALLSSSRGYGCVYASTRPNWSSTSSASGADRAPPPCPPGPPAVARSAPWVGRGRPAYGAEVWAPRSLHGLVAHDPGVEQNDWSGGPRLLQELVADFEVDQRGQ